MQGDGNLVLYTLGGVYKWQTYTNGSTSPDYKAIFQCDGNLVIYNGTQMIWNSGTAGLGETLCVQGDGNLVIYDSNGAAVWDSWSSDLHLRNSQLVYGPGKLTIRKNECIATNKAKLVMQNDGNLVLYRLPDFAPLWWSSTYSTASNTFAVFQGDGNFVVYSSPLLASYTVNAIAIALQTDANFVIYDDNPVRAVWNTGTYVP